MKESYSEEVANHTGPESCLDIPQGCGEALTGVRTGGLLSSETTTIQKPILWTDGEGNNDYCVKSRAVLISGGVVELGMYGNLLCGNRDIHEYSLACHAVGKEAG